MANRIYFAEKPPAIKQIMLPKLYELFKNMKGSIFVKKVIDTLEIYSEDHNDWYAIANAKLRIARMGCDSITVDAVLAIFADFQLVYEDSYVGIAKAVLINDKVSIIGELELINTINSNVCHKCGIPNRKCECMKKQFSNSTIKSLYNIERIHEKDFTIYDKPKLYDETGMFSSNNKSNENDEFAEAMKRLNPTIQGMIQTYKLKKTSSIQAIATELIRKNPKITEQELVKQLLQSGIK